METEMKLVMEKLDVIKNELDYIKERIDARHSKLSKQDIKAIEEGLGDEKRGRLLTKEQVFGAQ